LNNNIQPYSYPQRLWKDADGKMIKTSNLIYTRRAKMKQRREI